MLPQHRYLLESSQTVEWVDTIEADPRVSLRYGDAAATGLPDASVGFVNLCLVRKHMY